MKDLRPPTCRTHSIVTHTTCSSTHMYTLTNAYIIRIHLGHIHGPISCQRAPYSFTSIQRRKEVGKASCLPSLNASLRIRTRTHHVHGSRREKTHRAFKTPRPSFLIIFAPTGFNCHGAIFVLIEQAVNRITKENVK